MKSKAIKQQEALKRQEVWSTIPPADQIKYLDDRLGKDEGAKKQRAKILEALS